MKNFLSPSFRIPNNRLIAGENRSQMRLGLAGKCGQCSRIHDTADIQFDDVRCRRRHTAYTRNTTNVRVRQLTDSKNHQHHCYYTPQSIYIYIYPATRRRNHRRTKTEIGFARYTRMRNERVDGACFFFRFLGFFGLKSKSSEIALRSTSGYF